MTQSPIDVSSNNTPVSKKAGCCGDQSCGKDACACEKAKCCHKSCCKKALCIVVTLLLIGGAYCMGYKCGEKAALTTPVAANVAEAK